jgi:hypothetical protein
MAMGEWLARLSVTWLSVVIFTATYIVAGVIHTVVTRLAVGDRARAFKTVSAGLLPPLGILFGLFVAFIAAQVWSEIDRANNAVTNEASALSRVVFLAASFPGEPETQLRGLVRRHLDNVATVEWPMMARRKANLKITPLELGEAMQLALAQTPQSPGQTTAQREIVTALQQALDARRQRIVVSRSQVNPVKWAALLVQAICTLVAIAFVHGDNRLASGLALAIFSTGIAVSVMLIAAHDRPFAGVASIGPAPLLQVLPEEAIAQKAIDHSIILDLTTLLRAARQVISDRQGLIDEPRAGKELTADAVIAEAEANYTADSGHPLPALDPTSREGRMLRAELDAIEGVMKQAQPLINDPNRGFKGFVPAVFTYRVAALFTRKVGDLGYLKLTAPREVVRNLANAPDPWEDSVIKGKLAAPDWKKSDFFAEEASLNGKPAYRLLIPEYYEASCLSCHGEPKGASDITGGIKEGGKLGDLGGAISAAIYLK